MCVMQQALFLPSTVFHTRSFIESTHIECNGFAAQAPKSRFMHINCANLNGKIDNQPNCFAESFSYVWSNGFVGVWKNERVRERAREIWRKQTMERERE